MEDSQIVTWFWERNEKAIYAVDIKYRNFCFQIAWRLLSNQEDSEECISDTWFAAWKSIPPQKPSRLDIFLGKITRGFAIDRLRKQYAAKRADRHIVHIADETAELNRTVQHELDEQIQAEELLEIINRFLDKLSARDRDIFIQRYWAAETLKNIAARHKMSVGAVKQNLHRSKKKLQKVLEAEGRL